MQLLDCQLDFEGLRANLFGKGRQVHRLIRRATQKPEDCDVQVLVRETRSRTRLLFGRGGLALCWFGAFGSQRSAGRGRSIR